MVAVHTVPYTTCNAILSRHTPSCCESLVCGWAHRHRCLQQRGAWSDAVATTNNSAYRHISVLFAQSCMHAAHASNTHRHTSIGSCIACIYGSRIDNNAFIAAGKYWINALHIIYSTFYVYKSNAIDSQPLSLSMSSPVYIYEANTTHTGTYHIMA